MCLAVPAKVTKIDGDMATVEVGGIARGASLMLVDDVAVGDYVLVHAGFAIHRVDAEEAEESLRLLRQLVLAEEETA
ncbi:MAG: HypC/HybG/HupF family hydrogenase formation chaperone [Thermodesulfobacteriota bacterium]|nr:HypC/HybG/HupF family hydrogenase formation chaperone [Thermodesulfobacteriota bacterium]